MFRSQGCTNYFKNNYMNACRYTLWSLFFLIILSSCNRWKQQSAEADLRHLHDITESIKHGLQGYLESEHTGSEQCNTVGCDISLEKGELAVIFKNDGSMIEFTPASAALPSDWSSFDEIILTIENAGPGEIRLGVSIKGPRGILEDSVFIKPGQKVKHVTDLTDLPLTAGNQPLYSPQWIQIQSIASETRIILKSLKLKGTLWRGHQTVVDQFGQRKNKTWPGKIKSVGELIAAKESEMRMPDQDFDNGCDKFGGWIDGPVLESTGFFRVANHQGKYWFVTPEGRLMWSFGVTGVRPNAPRVGATRITGREFLFEQLPLKTGTDSICWTSEDDASFYTWNILRKYQDLQKWRERIFRRLPSWGYNTIGNWSEPEILRQAKIPFTVSFTTNMPGKTSIHSIADVFDPEWPAYVDSVLSEAGKWADNPWLLGYFTDNEAGWGNLDLLRNMPPDSWSRERWLEFLQNKYQTIHKLNNRWNVAFKEWSDVRDLMTAVDNIAFYNDYAEFETLFTEKYFSIISSTLKKHDPNHLYLGCRFTRKIKPDHICRIAGKYCDVISVNVYALRPEDDIMREWYTKTGRPVLIGEHHINLASDRQVPALWGATVKEARREYYRNYVETWAKLPYSLGCHWYQLTDQEITGRSSNGENQPIGLVDITDQPHQELIETARELSRKIYVWHAEQIP